MPDIDASNKIMDVEFDTTSLLLPYDYLRTPATPHSLIRGAETVRRIQGREGDLRKGIQSLLVASTAALFYRYCGQQRIPLAVRPAPGQHASHKFVVEADVNGQCTLMGLADALEADLGRKTWDAAGPNVLITFDPASAVADDRTFDIVIAFAHSSNDLSIAIDYNQHLFSSDTIRRLATHLDSIIQVASEMPGSSIASIVMFTDDEKRWFKDRCKLGTDDYTFVHAFRDVAEHGRRNPHKVAVRADDGDLTYRDLNDKANQLANFILAEGIQAEQRVAVCIEPSADIAFVLLGILKSGATYVPINPAFPRYRIDAIVEDTSPHLLITENSLRQLFCDSSMSRLLLDNDRARLDEQSVAEPEIEILPEHNAYIYYTSGTTGKPKGSMATHANLAHMLRSSRERYGISASEIIPAVASFTFSISMFELMSPLTAGGTLLVLPRETVLDVARMATVLSQVTMFHIGPSLLKNIVRHIKTDAQAHLDYSNIRHASSGGDMVPPELLRDMQEIFPAAEIFVIYGCSEISLMGCTWEIGKAPVQKTLVGQSFPTMHLKLLDDDGNEVPIGAPGDVHFGGRGVVRGYLNRPELTKKLFQEIGGLRYYSTGDRGRLNFAGELELLGRRDFQIQIRGMRVELGEIEYHLRQFSGVRDGVVAARNNQRGEAMLVAYIVAEKHTSFDANEIRRHMLERLPDYMVPAFYENLDALPLNYNMKVDRRALPDPKPAYRAVVSNPPQTDSEIALARLWCDILQLDTVSLDDNFMLLGGESLIAMDMILKAQQLFGVKLDGMDVLRESLFVLARIIDEHHGRKAQIPNRVFRAPDITEVESFHFGENEDVYGLFTKAQGSQTPVLICPSVGYEYNRCSFLMRTLADSLAKAGVASLRFDFFGSGDSLGRSTEARLERWRDDLRLAQEELMRRTGASHVRVFSYRLTTSLVLQSLNHATVESIVAWDPVTDGDEYYRELKRMNREKIHKLLVMRNMRKPAKIRNAEELMGYTFSDSAIREIRELSLDPGALWGRSVTGVFSADFDSSKIDELMTVVGSAVPVDADWYRSTRATAGITDKEYVRAFANALMGAPT